MLQTQRFDKIKEVVNQKGIVTTKEMAALLGVTEKTIRLDYEQLEKEGQLVRVHGGAKSIKKRVVTQRDEIQMPLRTEHAKEKDEICRRAAELVEDGACVYLDGGSSIVPMLKYLQDKKIKIVTNNQYLAREFYSETAEFYVIGGQYIPKYNMTAGPVALNEISKYNFDYAFIGCLGVDTERKVIYTAELDTMATKEVAMLNALHSILLIDSSKLFVRGFYSLISLDDFEKVYCDHQEYMDEEEMPSNFILI